MSKKDKDSGLDDYENLQNEIIRDRVNEIFHNYPKDYIAKMEEIGFKYFEDDEDSEEIEERNAKPVNKRQRNRVYYFENKCKLTKEIFESRGLICLNNDVNCLGLTTEMPSEDVRLTNQPGKATTALTATGSPIALVSQFESHEACNSA